MTPRFFPAGPLLALLFVAAVPLLAGCPEGTAEITVAPASLDFGEVRINQTSEESVDVSNVGDGPATIVFTLQGDGPFRANLSGPIEMRGGDTRRVFIQTTPAALGEVSDTMLLLWGADAETTQIALSVVGIQGDQLDQDNDGFSEDEGDCDDDDPTVFPGATEVCDGVDNDCNNILDDDADVDLDGSYGCDDCDDNDAENYPGNNEVCDGVDNDCNEEVDEDFDVDGDGVTTCADPADCDDNNSSVNPAAAEICNGLDDNCSGDADEGFEDLDGDGDAGCTDCDDNDPLVSRFETEVACDGLDNDCNGIVDDGDPDLDGDGFSTCDDCDDSNGAVFPGAPELCDGIDNDCDGEVESTDDVDSDGFTTCDGDCDDSDPTAFPGATEIACDGADNDCDTETDEGALDADSDGVDECSDCDDADPDNFPGNAEVCDGADNDCDTDADEGLDGDSDGVTPCGPDGIASNADDDCDDSDPNIYPGAPEVCGGADQDCDGLEPTVCTSCAEVLAVGSGLTSGIYTIDPDGAGGLAEFDAWCDMDVDGGGWTLVQRTTLADAAGNDTLRTSFASQLNDFVPASYDAQSGASRVPAAYWEALAAAGEIMVGHVLVNTAGGVCSPLYYSVTGGTLDVDAGTPAITYTLGSADPHSIVNSSGGQAVATFSGLGFGPRGTACVSSANTAVSWFMAPSGPCGSMLPGFGPPFTGSGMPPIPVVREDALGTDLDGNDETTVCAGGAPEATNTSPYLSVSEMTLYFR